MLADLVIALLILLVQVTWWLLAILYDALKGYVQRRSEVEYITTATEAPAATEALDVCHVSDAETNRMQDIFDKPFVVIQINGMTLGTPPKS